MCVPFHFVLHQREKWQTQNGSLYVSLPPLSLSLPSPFPNPNTTAIMAISSWQWIPFSIIVLVLFFLDNCCFHRKAHAPSRKEIIFWICFWAACGLGFNAWLAITEDSDDSLTWFVAYIVEYGLSFDNLFVFYLVFKVRSAACKSNVTAAHRRFSMFPDVFFFSPMAGGPCRRTRPRTTFSTARCSWVSSARSSFASSSSLSAWAPCSSGGASRSCWGSSSSSGLLCSALI